LWILMKEVNASLVCLFCLSLWQNALSFHVNSLSLKELLASTFLSFFLYVWGCLSVCIFTQISEVEVCDSTFYDDEHALLSVLLSFMHNMEKSLPKAKSSKERHDPVPNGFPAKRPDSLYSWLPWTNYL
jgi:hypothetical protein